MEFYSSPSSRRLQKVMACQAALATTSLIDALKASPWCLQRTLGPEKIFATVLDVGLPLFCILGRR
jgi:hypothetical protein